LDIYGGKGRIGHTLGHILGEEEIREEMGYLKIRDRIKSDPSDSMNKEGREKEEWRKKEKKSG